MSCSSGNAAENHPGPRILLLGLGNDILSDDAIGLRVAAAVRERLAGHKKITVIESTEMGLALLDLIVGFDTLLIVDAVQTGKVPVGFVHQIDTAELRALPTVSPHFLGISEMLALGAKLGFSMPQCVRICAVEVGDPLTVGTALTPALQNAFDGIVDHVSQALARIAQT